MLQTDISALPAGKSKKLYWPSLTPRGQRRLALWVISLVLFGIAASFLQDSIIHQSPIGIIFSSSWIGAILINSAIVDYLLRQKWIK